MRLTDELCEALSAIDLSVADDEVITTLARRLSEKGGLSWLPEFPISYVHNADRIKSEAEKASLKRAGWLKADGTVREGLTRAEIAALSAAFPELVQTTALAPCRPDADLDRLPYAPKREGDFWKRLQSADFLEAAVDLDIVPAARTTPEWIEHELQNSDVGQWQAEKALRDAVRSKKENTPLRQKPYIWITVVEGAVPGEDGQAEAMLRHYFGDNVVSGAMRGGCFVLGAVSRLDDMVLRKFYKKR